MQLSGVVPPMVTPSTDDQVGVDAETLGAFTEFLVDGGVHALFPCGSIGEFSSLTREQRRTVVETVANHADGVPILAGCGGTSVEEVRALVADATAAGADAAVVVTPYYLRTDDAGLVEFYRRVCRESELPVILYDIPSLTGNHLSTEAVVTLAECDGIVGIKDSAGNLSHHQELIERTPESFQVLQGLAELAITSLDAGSDGVVAGPANVYPHALSEIYEAYRAGNRAVAIDLWKSISNPIVAATEPLPTAVGLKYLLGRRGWDVGGPLPPLSGPSSADEERLDASFQRVDQHSQGVHSPVD